MGRILVPVGRVPIAEASGDEPFDRLPEQFVARVPESLGLRVDLNDRSLGRR